jgi:gamma-glutamylcysteine synthetase
MRWPRAFRRYSLLDLARELVEIAWEGLRRQNQVNDLGDDETIYLKPLKDLLSKANVRLMSCWKSGRASCTTTSSADRL